MKAIILCIGNEILLGQIQDTNSAYIAKELFLIGVETIEVKCIPDTEKAIHKALVYATENADLIISTGGLGPTKDDITKKTLSDFLDSPMVYSQEMYDHVVAIFEKNGRIPNELNKEQAFHPKMTQAIINPLGTAPLLWTNYKEKVIVNMPGVPHEMRNLMSNIIVEKLKTDYKLPFLLQRNLLCVGLPESELAIMLEDFENDLPKNVSLAYLPSNAMIKLRLDLTATEKEKAEKLLDGLVDKIADIVGNHIVSKEFEDFASIIKEKFTSKKLTLSFAESCTGGFMSSQIALLDGASQFYKGSMVTYATQSKIELLGISKATIDKYTVVSREVAEEMALNAKKLYKSNVACATTGVAGPTKGEDGKPIGTLCFAIATENEIFSTEITLNYANRKQFMKSSVNKVLGKLIGMV